MRFANEGFASGMVSVLGLSSGLVSGLVSGLGLGTSG